MNLKNLKIDKSWTIFLDRDGVINEKLEGDYVKKIAEFRFIDKAKDAIKLFSDFFGNIVIVTNQQGIGKGIMSEVDLIAIHKYMVAEIESHGGRIDRIYFSPDLADENSITRKPNTGLAVQAKKDIPDIDFSKSIMVGDSQSDMQFGRKLNMINVLIAKEKHFGGISKSLYDLCFGSLFEFSQYICR